MTGALTVTHPETGPAVASVGTGATNEAMPPACTVTTCFAVPIGVCRTTS